MLALTSEVTRMFSFYLHCITWNKRVLQRGRAMFHVFLQ